MFTRKLFATAGALAAVATLMTAAPAHAAHEVTCSFKPQELFRISISGGGMVCVYGTGRFQRDIGNVTGVGTGQYAGTYDYVDTDGYMTTRYLPPKQYHGLNGVTFHSVYLERA